jgi:hypothetical protein
VVRKIGTAKVTPTSAVAINEATGNSTRWGSERITDHELLASSTDLLKRPMGRG